MTALGCPRRVPPAGRAPRQVAVMGDGTGPGACAPPGRPLGTALAADADALQVLATVPAVAVPVAERDSAAAVAAQIRRLPEQICAVFLTRITPPRARAVQRGVEEAGGRPVLTDEDATAIALTAAALVYLRGLGRDPYRSTIVVAAAIRMPILSALLVAAGFPDITLWNAPDAVWFPLHRAARDADVVIDLQRDPGVHRSGEAPAGGERRGVEFELDRPEGSVITPSALDGRTLIAPGLLRALAEYPAPAPPLGLGIYGACARAVAQATPARGHLRGAPDGDPVSGTTAATRDVADAIADAVAQHLALDRP